MMIQPRSLSQPADTVINAYRTKPRPHHLPGSRGVSTAPGSWSAPSGPRRAQSASNRTKGTYRGTRRGPFCTCVTGTTHHSLLLSTLHELYKQQITSSLSEIRKRLERKDVCDWLKNNVKTVASASPLEFHVVENDSISHEPYIFLNKPPPSFEGFIQPTARELPYPPEIVAITTAYVTEKLRRNEGAFRGGRHLMAVDLKEEGPPELRAMSLGKLCHVVQLLLSERIVVYDSNFIKPIVASCSRAKVLWARNSGKPPVSLSRALQRIRRNMQTLLHMNTDGIVLSQLRTVYEAAFKEPFEFHSLGYTKLASFLQEQMADICDLVAIGPFNSVVVSHEYLKKYPSYPPFRQKPSECGCDDGRAELVSFTLHSLRNQSSAHSISYNHWRSYPRLPSARLPSPSEIGSMGHLAQENGSLVTYPGVAWGRDNLPAPLSGLARSVSCSSMVSEEAHAKEFDIPNSASTSSGSTRGTPESPSSGSLDHTWKSDKSSSGLASCGEPEELLEAEWGVHSKQRSLAVKKPQRNRSATQVKTLRVTEEEGTVIKKTLVVQPEEHYTQLQYKCRNMIHLERSPSEMVRVGPDCPEWCPSDLGIFQVILEELGI